MPSAPVTTPAVVVADPHARYFGTELAERSLVAGPDAQLGATRFDDWLAQSLPRLDGPVRARCEGGVHDDP